MVFWQEHLLSRFAADTGTTISTAEELILLLEPAIAKILSEPTPPDGFTLVPAACPKEYTPEEWADVLQGSEDYHEEVELENDAILRQAKSWHDEAVRLSHESESARRDGNEILAAERLRQALASAKRAADHCRQQEESVPVTSYHRFAANLALACGDFHAATTLSDWMGRSLERDNPETASKRWEEISKEKREIQEQAERVRERLVGERLQEITFTGGVAAFSADSKSLAIVAGENRVRVFDLDSQRLAFEFEGEFSDELPKMNRREHRIGSIGFSPDGRTIALAGFDGSVVFWDTASQKSRHVIAGHLFHTFSLAFSPDGRLVATAGADCVKLWDPITGKKRGSFARKINNDHVAFSPDSARIAWARNDGMRLAVLEIATRTEVSVKSSSDLRDVAFSACGSIVAMATVRGHVKLFELPEGREIATFISGVSTRTWQSCSVAFSPDRKLMATASAWHVLLWDLATRKCIFAIPDTQATTRVRFSPDGQYLASSGGKLRIWRVAHLLSLDRELSSLVEEMGTVEFPTKPRNVFEQVAAPTPIPAKMPPPEHLRTCTVAVPSRCRRAKYVAHVQCLCGGKTFRLLHAGEIWTDKRGHHFPKETKAADGVFFVIAAQCRGCGKEHVLFDNDWHGWNGFVCFTEGRSRPRPKLVPWNCDSCSEQEHTATIEVLSEGRQEAIEESSDFLTEANWQEGFGSIVIATKCGNCGHKCPNWVEYETM